MSPESSSTVRERRSASASDSSAARWAVMSREMPNVPITVPSAARSGSFEVLTQALRPSGNVSRSSKPMIGCPVAMIRCSSQNACAACSSENTSKSVLPTTSSGALEAEPAGELRGHVDEPPAVVLEVHLVGRALQEHVQQPALIERVGAVIAWRCAVSHVKEDRLMSARSRAIGRLPRHRDREAHWASPLISRRRFPAPDADDRIGATAAPRNRRRHRHRSGTAALIAARDTSAPNLTEVALHHRIRLQLGRPRVRPRRWSGTEARLRSSTSGDQPSTGGVPDAAGSGSASVCVPGSDA